MELTYDIKTTITNLNQQELFDISYYAVLILSGYSSPFGGDAARKIALLHVKYGYQAGNLIGRECGKLIDEFRAHVESVADARVASQ